MRHFFIIAILICIAVYGTSGMVNIFLSNARSAAFFFLSIFGLQWANNLSLFPLEISLRYTSISYVIVNNTYLEFDRIPEGFDVLFWFEPTQLFFRRFGQLLQRKHLLAQSLNYSIPFAVFNVLN